VWLVELASVGDPAGVPDALASALRVVQQPGLSVAESVIATVADREMLLVLDNCEHVLDPVATFAAALLERSASVDVLATSREGLRVRGEQLWPVPSMGTGAEVDDAVELFLERAHSARPGMSFDEFGDIIAEICARLDGIALAIELAAARTVSMSPREIRDRLDDRFRLLTAGTRGLERHQTLHHTVAWSYELLSAPERRLLMQCSVFIGGFQLGGAVAVGADNDLDDLAVLDGLDSLVRKSLISSDQTPDGTRYELLETIRQFAEGHLIETGAAALCRDQHGEYCERSVVRDVLQRLATGDSTFLKWFSSELGNLRAAFDWAIANEHLDRAAAIAIGAAAAAAQLQLMEPLSWTEKLISHPKSDSIQRLPALLVSATLLCHTGRVDEAIAFGHRALELRNDPRFQPPDRVAPFGQLGTVYMMNGELERFVELADLETDTYGDPMGFWRSGAVWSLHCLGRSNEAQARLPDAIASSTSAGVPFAIAYANIVAGLVSGDNPATAYEHLEKARRVAEDGGMELMAAYAHLELCRLHTNDPDADRSRALMHLDDAASRYLKTGALSIGITFCAIAAITFHHFGHHDIAATLAHACRDNPHVQAAYPEVNEIPIPTTTPAPTLRQAATDTRTRIAELVNPG